MDLSEFRRRIIAYKANTMKAYALIWDKCARSMKNKIEERSDYAGMENDPISLLQAIKEHSLNYQKNKYAMSIIYEAYNNLFTTKQIDNESLQEYTQRFKTATEVLETHTGGPIKLKKLINKNMKYIRRHR